MTRIWEWNRPVTVREVLEDLQKERTIAYTTVMTVLDNLHQKGWVRREAEGRAYRYEAVSTRAAYAAALMNESWSASDNPAAALVAFFGMMSPEQRAALRDAVHMVGIEQAPSAASEEARETPADSASSSPPTAAGTSSSPTSPAPVEPKSANGDSTSSPNGDSASSANSDSASRGHAEAAPDGRARQSEVSPVEESEPEERREPREPREPEEREEREEGKSGGNAPGEDAAGDGPGPLDARPEPGPPAPDAER